MDSIYDIEIPIEDFLEHYGVKGMRWGVRKSAAQRDAEWEAKRSKSKFIFTRAPYSARRVADLTIEASKTMKPEMRALNRNPKYNNRKAKRLIRQDRGYLEGRNPISAQYKKEASAIYMKHVKLAAAKKLQVSPSGKWKEEFYSGGRPGPSGYWNVKLVPNDGVTHAATSDTEINFKVRPIEDDDGFIIDFELVEDSLKQDSFTTTKELDLYLEHYGVKGMRWGVRRNKSGRASKTRRFKRKPNVYKEAKSLSDEDLKKAVERLRMEQSYVQMRKSLKQPNPAQKILRKTGDKTIEGIAAGAATAAVAFALTKAVPAIVKKVNPAGS